MNFKETLARVVERHDLDRGQMGAAMRAIMSGETTPAQIAGFLIALRMKGETVDEITAAAEVMRELVTKVSVDKAYREQLVDTCGTGGDASGLFNVSTACAFVVAAAGGRVAKHGNRSVSSRSGSADVLEAAGVKLELGPKDVARCIKEVGVGFMFAPAFHGAMKHAIGPRKEMGVRTIFNLIGPLTNPANAPNQVLGVFDVKWVEPLAEVLDKLGSQHVMVVNSEEGLDEISIVKPTLVAELREGMLRVYAIDPAEYGLNHSSLEALKVNNAQESLALIRRIFGGEPGPARDMLLLNAGAALYVCGKARDLAQGIEQAVAAIQDGGAARKLESLVALSRQLGAMAA
ncbi:MAG: anthranilate phosphoribosyltransferase [Nevskiales bacterium]